MPTARLVQAPVASCAERSASVRGVTALLDTAFTDLLQAWLCGQAVSGRCLAMAVISTLQAFE